MALVWCALWKTLSCATVRATSGVSRRLDYTAIKHRLAHLRVLKQSAPRDSRVQTVPFFVLAKTSAVVFYPRNCPTRFASFRFDFLTLDANSPHSYQNIHPRFQLNRFHVPANPEILHYIKVQSKSKCSKRAIRVQSIPQVAKISQ